MGTIMIYKEQKIMGVQRHAKDELGEVLDFAADVAPSGSGVVGRQGRGGMTSGSAAMRLWPYSCSLHIFYC